jgi:hypothetical protein
LVKGFLKFAALVAFLLVLFVGVPVAGFFYVFFVADQVTVHAQERHGDTVRISIPASFVTLALDLGRPWMTISSRPHRQDLRDLRGAMRVAADEMSRHPEIPLVEVIDGGDHVRIVKEGERLRIFVDSAQGDTVRIDLPARMVERFIGNL